MDNLEIDNENERAYETKFCAILLESARRYSTLAGIVFNVSVQQSNFASTISGQRMTLAKLAIQKQTDFTVILEGNELETYQTTEQTDNVIEMWEDCLSFDEVIQKILKTSDTAKWEPVILGVECQHVVHPRPTLKPEVSCQEPCEDANNCSDASIWASWLSFSMSGCTFRRMPTRSMPS